MKLVRIKLKYVRETESSLVVYQQEDDPRVDEEIHLPLSQITKVERHPDGNVVVTMPEWLAEKENL